MVTMLMSLSVYPKKVQYQQQATFHVQSPKLYWVSTKQLTLTPSSPVKPEAVLLMEATAGQQPAGKDREENITYTAHPNRAALTRSATHSWGAPKIHDSAIRIPSETVKYFATQDFLLLTEQNCTCGYQFPYCNVYPKKATQSPKNMAWKMSLIRLTFLSCKLSFNVILAVAGTNTSEWHWTWESNPPVSLELRRKPLALQDRFTNV